jgi:Endonuclease NucS
MPFSMNLWQVQGQDLQEINHEALNDEQRLEDWVVKDPSILGIDVLLIGRQVTTASHGRIDLLAIDGEANLVVLELKRDKTPREIVAQALDYASWVNDLSYEQIETITKNFTAKPLSQAFSDHYGFSIPQTVNGNHSMVILASELDDSSERIVQYLGDQYGVPINVLFFTFFKTASSEFVGRAWLKDPEEVQERTQARNQAPWSGFYFVNVGEGDHRNWDDCRKYGFLAAGQGEKYGNAMKKLKPSDLVFAYMKGIGYVGFGTVTQSATMVRDFVPDGSDKKLLDLPLKQPNLSDHKDDPTLSEWVVGVKWEKTFERDQAKRFQGIFANQNIVCLLRDPSTVDFLRKEFSVSSKSAPIL